MRIREWEETDLGAMIQMGAEMHQESPHYRDIPYDPQSLVRFAKQAIKMRDAVTALMAVEGPEILGFIIIGMQPYFFSKAMQCVDMLIYVKPIYRMTTPAGPMLIDAGQKWGFERGALECRFGESTGVVPHLVAKLFEKKGFHEVGRLYAKRRPE